MKTSLNFTNVCLQKIVCSMPISLLLMCVRRLPTVFFCHLVTDDPLPHVCHLYATKTPREFEADLDYLLREFRPITLEQLKSIILNGDTPPKRSFYLTVDDGLRQAAEIMAPMFQRKGIPAAFFISPAFLDNVDMSYRFKISLLIGIMHERKIPRSAERAVEDVLKRVHSHSSDGMISTLLQVSFKKRHLLDEIANILEYNFEDYLRRERPYMSTEQVCALARDGFDIGSHSVLHPSYAELNLEEQLGQTRDGARMVRERFGVDRGIFAFPFSERGVGDDFFHRIIREETIDLLFGTSGWEHESDKRLVQRVQIDLAEPPLPVFLRASLLCFLINRLKNYSGFRSGSPVFKDNL
ncbi:MAG: polysaccharide deacetylase family protein [Syntrophobacteraceae bacterium]